MIESRFDDRYRLLVETVVEYGIFLLDLDGVILSWNPGAEKIKGYSASEIIGKHYSVFFTPEDINNNKPNASLEIASREGRFQEEAWRLKKDGSKFWAFIVVTALRDEQGNIVGYGKVTRDLTHTKLLEEHLKVAKDSAVRAKASFLTNMSHEIRTPLSAMIGFAELMRDPSLNAKDKEKYLDIISRNGKDLSGLIDGILDLSKVEAGKLDLARQKFLVKEFLSELMNSFSEKAKERSLTFTLKNEGQFPEEIWSDPTRLRQILSNVIGNAIKFTEIGGEVEICVKAVPGILRTPPLLTFTIRDSGCGIPDSLQRRLFQWFDQADNSITRKFGGMGLGLALSQRLARALGGDVCLKESIMGFGSTFVVSVASQPARQEQPTKATLASEANARATRALETESSIRGLRILVVEDALDNQMLIRQILTKRGATVEIANNGLEGIEKATQGTHDIVLMDIQMPVLDGISATNELRKAGYRKPIVALTAHALKEERERTMAAGCNEHLTKPINIPLLIGTIARFAKVEEFQVMPEGIESFSTRGAGD